MIFEKKIEGPSVFQDKIQYIRMQLLTCTIYCVILQLDYRLCIAHYAVKFCSGVKPGAII